MRQYSEIRAEQLLSTPKDEYFMYALKHVSSITGCDLPKSREAAITVGMQPNPIVISAMAAKLCCPENIAHEMWMRYGVHQHFESLLGGSGLEEEALQRLKDFFFQRLYPLQ